MFLEGNYVSGYDPVHNVVPQRNTGLYDVSPHTIKLPIL